MIGDEVLMQMVKEYVIQWSPANFKKFPKSIQDQVLWYSTIFIFDSFFFFLILFILKYSVGGKEEQMDG